MAVSVNTAIELLLHDVIDTYDLVMILLAAAPKPNRGTGIRRTVPCSTVKFDLDKISDADCSSLLRFNKQEIKRLYLALNLPHELCCENGLRASGLEGLCITLRRLSFLSRLCDLETIFHRDVTSLSRIFTATLETIYASHGHLLKNLNQKWLSHDSLHKFGDAIHSKGSPFKRIWGFIDAAARPICGPCYNQKPHYSRHKYLHCVKFQAIMCPNGLIARLDGPYVRKRHDSAFPHLKGLVTDMENSMTLRNGSVFRVFGDSEYPNSKFVLSPYKAARPGSKQALFNEAMASLRANVEWGFGKVIQQFAFCDFKKNKKLRLQPLGQIYAVSTLFANCHTCLNGSSVSTFFDVLPPTLEDYLTL